MKELKQPSWLDELSESFWKGGDEMSEKKLTRDEELKLLEDLLEHMKKVYALCSNYFEEYADLIKHTREVEAKLGCKFSDYKL